MNDDKIKKIYHTYIESLEYVDSLTENLIDISWLKQKLNYEEYTKLEELILAYASQNDEILFKSGFQFAWDLCRQCNADNRHAKK